MVTADQFRLGGYGGMGSQVASTYLFFEDFFELVVEWERVRTF
jgi:hypothetical protein